MSDEENHWIEGQNQKYDNVDFKFNFNSLVGDMFGVLFGQDKFTQYLERKLFQHAKNKLEGFLNTTLEFQSIPSIEQEVIWTRNIRLASLFLALLFTCKDTPEEQFEFFQSQLSLNSVTKYIMSIVKPKQLITGKTIHEHFYPIFASKEEEEYYDQLLIDSKKLKMFPLIDLRMLTLAILFYSEYEENVSPCTSYRDFLLRIFQKRQQLKNPEFNVMNLYFEMIERLKVFSTFEGFSRTWNAIK